MIDDTGRGRVDMKAPFYDFVMEVDRITRAEQRARYEAAIAARLAEEVPT